MNKSVRNKGYVRCMAVETAGLRLLVGVKNTGVKKLREALTVTAKQKSSSFRCMVGLAECIVRLASVA